MVQYLVVNIDYSDALAAMFHKLEQVLQGQIVIHPKKHYFGKCLYMKPDVVGLKYGVGDCDDGDVYVLLWHLRYTLVVIGHYSKISRL